MVTATAPTAGTSGTTAGGTTITAETGDKTNVGSKRPGFRGVFFAHRPSSADLPLTPAEAAGRRGPRSPDAPSRWGDSGRRPAGPAGHRTDQKSERPRLREMRGPSPPRANSRSAARKTRPAPGI